MSSRLLPIALLMLALFPIPAPAEDQPVTRLPEVTATRPAGALSEEQPVGETGRPAWTSSRRFTTTRVYLQKDPWEIGFEQLVRSQSFDDGSWKHRFQEEIELGLPGRMQLDLYGNWTADEERRSRWENFSVELRFALADWGRIPLNPTVYGEYKFTPKNEGPDVAEFKLLLGQQLAPRVHWGLNFVWERELGGEQTVEWQAAQGVSYTLIDGVISAGAEMKYVYATTRSSRGDPEHTLLLGPSIQIQPTRRTHLDLVGLIGVTEESPRVEAYLVFGIDFGKIGGGSSERYNPVSLRAN